VFENEEARRDSERLRELCMLDPLSGLANRRYVEEQLPLLLAEALEAEKPIAVALVDLDHFKRVNDECSHEVGDRVLVEVAGLLAAAADGGFAARMGGEEFLLVLPGSSRADALRRCGALRRAVRDHDWSSLTGSIAVTASMGVAVAEAGVTTAAELLRRADRHLYAAKRSGRDRVIGGAEPGEAEGP